MKVALLTGPSDCQARWYSVTPNGVMGLPADYVPYQTPINNTPGTPNYGNNNVPVRLNDGRTVVTGYSPGPAGANPFSQTVLPGPINYVADLSLYKTFSITERVNLRFNVDAFNAFNIQGRRNPNIVDGLRWMAFSRCRTPIGRLVRFSSQFACRSDRDWSDSVSCSRTVGRPVQPVCRLSIFICSHL
jgi:hypothetical protein